MRPNKTDPELPVLLPFQPGIVSNGEFVPPEPTLNHRRIAALAYERGTEIARRKRVDRRRFLMGMGGLAVTLGAVNLVACGDGDEPGGSFELPDPTDDDAVCELLEGQEFIFDIQTHHVNLDRQPGRALASLFDAVNPSCSQEDQLECFSRYGYIKDIFLESETTVGVLSDTPSVMDTNDPLTFEEMRRTRDIIDMLSTGGASRLLLHSIVVPNVGRLEDQLDLMQARAETMDVSAWKVYTPYSGEIGRGWFLDDEDYGIPFIEKARELGGKLICAHKGLPLFGFDPEYASPRDMGVVAAAYPDMSFVAYHSGFDPNNLGAEGPYNPDSPSGVDRLIKSLEDNGVAPNSNVYAELGSTWRSIMSDPTQAAHVLGKLLKYVGEDNVLWGTDCIWYGAPQPQIVAFRAFQIDPQLAQQHGYPELTPEVKAKVFGLNAARLYGIDAEAQRCAIQRDAVEDLRETYRELEPDTHELRWAPHMPISRRGVLRHFAQNGGSWSPWR
ncbi:MAG: amidohydrolase family protein [Dehalococcoidia bacterium]